MTREQSNVLEVSVKSYGNENARVPCEFCHVKKNKGKLEKEGDLLAALGMRISPGRQG